MAVETATLGKSTLQTRARKRTMRRVREAPVYAFLLACALVSVITTVGIIFVLLEETLKFFADVSLFEFLGGTEWTPTFSQKSFGVLPLLNATIMMALGAMLVAVPLGLLVAIYLSEYAPHRIRQVVKPVLEILAGIPTVVYGYFALHFIAPEMLRPLGQETSFSAAAASLAMAIMILPLVSSLSEDAMRAVPQALREGAYGLGANKFEVATRVVVPAALSGIVAACILATSRAVGETMIVTIAAGGQPNLSWNPLDGMQALTAYIVQVLLGDVERGGIEYKSIYAVGMLLFVVTLVMNIFAQWFLSRFREEYE